MSKIVTVRDARIANLQAKADADYLREKRRLKAKVRHWTKRAEKFGGEINLQTLYKFQIALAAHCGESVG